MEEFNQQKKPRLTQKREEHEQESHREDGGKVTLPGPITDSDIDSQMEDLQRRLAESEARVVKLTVLNAKSNGFYYATIDDVWQPYAKHFAETHFNELRRSECPSFKLRATKKAASKEKGEEQGKLKQESEKQESEKQEFLKQQESTRQESEQGDSALYAYETTRARALEERNVAVDAADRSRTSQSSSSDKTAVWPTDIFGNSSLADIAHLIPASPTAADLYDDVALWVLALEGNPARVIKQRAIHGCADGVDGSRIDFTGIKHLVANKIRLGGQKDFYNKHPCLLVVPLMSVKTAKMWNGEGYDALVMAGTFNAASNISVICQYAGMTFEGDVAEPANQDDNAEEIKTIGVANAEEVEMARQFLETVLCGLAYSVLVRKKNGDTGLCEAAQKNLLEVQEKFRSFFATHPDQILAPAAASLINRPVLKTSFASHDEFEGHPAPDPILLAVKAAVNWSARNDQKLMAAADIFDDDDDDSERDIMAEEAFLRRRDQLHRPHTREDLAKGLHQPNGYVSSEDMIDEESVA